MRRRCLVPWVLVAGAVGWAGPAAAGWVADWAVRRSPGPVVQRDSVQANRVKLLWLRPDAGPVLALIADLDAQTLSEVHHEPPAGFARRTLIEHIEQ